jgi:TPR repeat protein
MYGDGIGVEKDEKKKIYHPEEAAIAGHPVARYILGILEGRNKRFKRSAKHFIIAAKLGHNRSIQLLNTATQREWSAKMALSRLFAHISLP